MRKKLLLVAFAYLTSLSSGFTMSVSLSHLDDACGESSGRIHIDGVFGGVSPYTFLWSTGATTDTIYGLSAGTYTVTVTDANSTTATASVTLVNNAQLNLAYNYSYVTLTDKKDKVATFENTEGNNWSTENGYMVLVYFRPFGARADELVGYARVNSSFQR